MAGKKLGGGRPGVTAGMVFSAPARARAEEGGGEGSGRPALPLSRTHQALGFKCSSTLAMALRSSSPQPWATPVR